MNGEKLIKKIPNANEQLYDFTIDVINIIICSIFSENKKVKIDNIEYPKIIIREMFLKLELQHIKEVLRRYKQSLENSYFKNPSRYIETILQSVCFDYGLVKILNEA